MSERKSPDPNEVRYAFSSLVQNFDSFLSFVSTEKSPKFGDYLNRLNSVTMELIQIHGELQLLTITNYRKYNRAREDMWKIMSKLMIDVHHLEDKHMDKFFFWESAFQKGKMRKDLIKFYKDISKQMKKIQKSI